MKAIYLLIAAALVLGSCSNRVALCDPDDIRCIDAALAADAAAAASANPGDDQRTNPDWTPPQRRDSEPAPEPEPEPEPETPPIDDTDGELF
ncbi:MAG: hypothetical protein JSU82_03515 [Rhodospirillales bacterium]|nr:MAG: hypothetical protein JSU82_03515 [Rhodospirillales bacterium]